MSYDDKMSIGLRLAAELFFFIIWLILLLKILAYNDAVHACYGQSITFRNALSFLGFNQSEGMKLFTKSVIFLLAVSGGTFVSFRTSYNYTQVITSVVLLVLNIFLLFKLVMALSNPVLFALFLVAAIAMVFSTMI